MRWPWRRRTRVAPVEVQGPYRTAWPQERVRWTRRALRIGVRAIGCIVALASLALAACASGLATVDKASLQDAARLNLAAYEHLDGGPRALERGAYCATAAVLRRNGVPSVDIGAADGGTPTIACGP